MKSIASFYAIDFKEVADFQWGKRHGRCIRGNPDISFPGEDGLHIIIPGPDRESTVFAKLAHGYRHKKRLYLLRPCASLAGCRECEKKRNQRAFKKYLYLCKSNTPWHQPLAEAGQGGPTGYKA